MNDYKTKSMPNINAQKMLKVIDDFNKKVNKIAKISIGQYFGSIGRSLRAEPAFAIGYNPHKPYGKNYRRQKFIK